MALKDWKKIQPKWIAPKELYRWQNQKKLNYFIGISKFLNGDYFVSMTFEQYLGGFDKKRNFKTKSQALKFAKSYMRKH